MKSFWGAKGTPILFSEIGFCMASCSYIRQHGSAVYVEMVVVVCIPYYNGKLPLAFYRDKHRRME